MPVRFDEAYSVAFVELAVASSAAIAITVKPASGARGFGGRGVAVSDDFGDRERSEDPERDQHVDRRGRPSAEYIAFGHLAPQLVVQPALGFR